MRKLWIVAAGMALMAADTFVLAQPSPPMSRPPSGPQSGGRRQSPLEGPWNRDLHLCRSGDGRTFSDSRVIVERGGVPCVIRDSAEDYDTESRLIAVFQWFPLDDRSSFDRVAVIFSRDEGRTWTRPLRIAVDGLPEGAMRPFDPTVVRLSDGRYRLYFTSQMPSRRKPGIYSAISSDAVSYTFEPGLRSDTDATVVDAGAIFWRGQWHMFAHYSGQAGPPSPGRANFGYHAVSRDGLNFTKLADVEGPQGANWIGNPVIVGERLRYYATGQGGIWSAESLDGATWRADPAVRAQGGDPSVVRLGDGAWMMIAVGERRADAVPNPFQESVSPPSEISDPYMRSGPPPQPPPRSSPAGPGYPGARPPY
jgi:hypothetical protein